MFVRKLIIICYKDGFITFLLIAITKTLVRVLKVISMLVAVATFTKCQDTIDQTYKNSETKGKQKKD